MSRNGFIDFQNQMFMDYININPSNVKGQLNFSTLENKRYLYNLIYSVFKIEMPKFWNRAYFRFFVFHYGNLGVFYTKKFGWIPMPFTPESLDIFFYPKKMIGNNPMIDDPVLGIRRINSEIIYIFDDLFGFETTVNKYAQKLANVDKAFDVNLLNSSFALQGFVENEKEAIEIKAAYSKASYGEPLIVVNKRLKNSLENFVNAPKNQLAAIELHQARRAVINDFLTEIGIRNANYEKRERLNSQEVSENDDETKAQAQIVLENLTECFERVKEVTGGEIDLKVSLNEEYEIIKPNETKTEEGDENV